jgi:pimeloyl-ACP methyl ester carboxylesterase
MFVTSGGAQLAYEITGVDDGADVLLIHAGVNDRRSWQHVIKRLASRHRCIAYDARGFGETTYKREDGWSAVADAGAVLDAAGVEQAVVVASSIGGRTALDLILAQPNRVSGLVLIGAAVRGAPYPDHMEGLAAELDAMIETAEAAGEIDEVNRLDARMWLDGPTAVEGRVGGPARELFFDMNGKALRAESPGKEAEMPPTWPRLGEITAPTLVMIGRLDVDDIQAIHEPLVKIIPNARLMWLDDVAHLPHLEGDRKTLDEIARFVDAIP